MRQISILYVEDHEPSRHSLVRFLQGTVGISDVHSAANLEEANKLLKSRNFSLIIGAHRVYGERMRGADWLKSLRESGNNTPFILFTPANQLSLRREAAKYAAHFLLKGATCIEIIQSIEEALKLDSPVFRNARERVTNVFAPSAL